MAKNKINVKYDVLSNENIEKAISKFNELVNNEGIIKKFNEKRYYVKKSEEEHKKKQRKKREKMIEKLKTDKKRNT